MSAAQLPAFADRFDGVARQLLAENDLVPELRVDLEVPLDDVGDNLEGLLRHFEPFGVGNPAPVFTSRQVQLAAPPRKVGSDGLRVSLSTSTSTIEGIGWGLASRVSQLDVGRPLDLAFRIERDEYRGVSRLQLRLADFRTT